MSSNFVEVFKQGKLGRNFGLPTGINALDRAINGLQRKTSIGLAAAPKCGKTTMADYCFLLSPYLHMLKEGKLDNIEWIYFSYEVDRISKEFKFAAFFMAYDYGIYNYWYKGKLYLMNQDYLMGKEHHKLENGTSEFISITEDHEAKLKEIYIKRIVPLFGEYDAEGKQITEGKIRFIEEPENPTGINKLLWLHARRNGKFNEQQYTTTGEQGEMITRNRITGYHALNPEMYTIVMMDHIRKMKRERGFSMKENIDKWLEYSTILRNFCSFTFINICHSNRNLANPDRLRYAGEFVFPTADDVKDSGNLPEESTVFMTLFNPNDEKYNLKKHFGVDLENYPHYRSIHITESRYTDCPVHIRTNMLGGVNMFTPIDGGVNLAK